MSLLGWVRDMFRRRRVPHVPLTPASAERIRRLQDRLDAGPAAVVHETLRLYDFLCDRVLAGDRVELVMRVGVRQEVELEIAPAGERLESAFPVRVVVDSPGLLDAEPIPREELALLLGALMRRRALGRGPDGAVAVAFADVHALIWPDGRVQIGGDIYHDRDWGLHAAAERALAAAEHLPGLWRSIEAMVEAGAALSSPVPPAPEWVAAMGAYLRTVLTDADPFWSRWSDWMGAGSRVPE